MPKFDDFKADVACNFFELVLKHTADEYWGKPFVLAPWQEDAVRHLFGWTDDNDAWLTKIAYLEVPKKSGKSEMCAGLILLALALANKPGFQVYGAAASQKQSLNVYRAACKMVEQSPELSRHLRIMRGTHRIVKRSDPDSFYAAIAADGDFSDGMNPAFVVADELHRWRTRKQMENWDVLTLSGITRKESMTVGITTAGVQSESPLAWRLHEKTLKIRDGVISDHTFYGRVYSADPGDNWEDEKTWIKAHPSLIENGGFLPLAKLRETYRSMLSDPEGQRSFRRYYLNLWDEKEDRAIDIAKWDACAGGWEAKGLLPRAPEDKVRPLPASVIAHFVDRPCFVGVDLSVTTDMTAVVAVFPPKYGSQDWDILPFYWMPKATVRQRELQDGVTYQTWADQGFIELCDGEAISHRDVKDRIEWCCRMFSVQETCFDPYNSDEMTTLLLEDGHDPIKVPQRFNLSNATRKFIELVATGHLRHGGHPVMKWNASCLALKGDGSDNVKPIKPQRDKERTRIDGVAAAITAMSRALVSKPTKPSIYATAASM